MSVAQNKLNENVMERLNFLDKLVNDLYEVMESHEKVLHEQAKQIEELTRQMNELLEKA